MRNSSSSCKTLWHIGIMRRPDYIEYYVMELTSLAHSRSSTKPKYASYVHAQSTSASAYGKQLLRWIESKTSYTDFGSQSEIAAELFALQL